MRRIRPRTIALIVAATALSSACSGTTSDSTALDGTTTTTEADTSTTGAAVTTTTAPPTTTAVSVNDEAEGSGCTPGEGDLPDGEWYGVAAEVLADEIEFDLACLFTGDAATRAAAEDGEESPPPNDYYVRNVNPTLRTVPVGDGDGVTVVWYPQFGDPTSEATISFDEWREALADRGDFIPGIWIEIEDGVISEVREHWVP